MFLRGVRRGNPLAVTKQARTGNFVRRQGLGWFAAAIVATGFGLCGFDAGAQDATTAASGDTAVVAPPDTAPVADTGPLGGYNVLIADRGNNRLLLVNEKKDILWTYHFEGLPPDSGADDAFFADDGKSIIVNLEHQQVIQIIDRATKKVTWQYGELGKTGSKPGFLNFPDDAYKLPNGDVVVADIRNCRILEIAPDKHIVRQAGKTGKCWGGPETLASPNGDKPLPNGHLLISTITDHSIVELDENWNQVLRLSLPIGYPSDPQMTAAGNFLVAGYTNPGTLIEVARDGTVVWEYKPTGDGALNRPSLAIELPNGNLLLNDDLNARVVVIEKATSKIIWQYGVTGQPGTEPGHLHIPDGLDIIKAD